MAQLFADFALVFIHIAQKMYEYSIHMWEEGRN